MTEQTLNKIFELMNEWATDETYDFDMLEDSLSFIDNVVIIAKDCDLEAEEWEVIKTVERKEEGTLALWKSKHIDNMYAVGYYQGFVENNAVIFIIKE